MRQVAERLRGVTRVVDIDARIGGEEFVVLLPDTHATAARIAAERNRQSIAFRPFDGGAGCHRQWAVTVSIGVATAAAGETDLTLDTLAERADRALYAAKRQGRDRVLVAAPPARGAAQESASAS